MASDNTPSLKSERPFLSGSETDSVTHSSGAQSHSVDSTPSADNCHVESECISGNVEIEEDIIVCQVRSDSMLNIPIKVQGYDTAAVIDTAAAITLLSDRLYDKLNRPGVIIKKVTLQTAARDLQMDGFIVGPITLTLGGKEFNENI